MDISSCEKEIMSLFCKEIIEDLINQFNLKIKNRAEFPEQNFDKYSQQIKMEGKGNFYFIKTCPQNGTALCGFHCLFNIINYLSYLKATSNSDKNIYLRKLNSPTK
jgi:hypothetical protein